MVSWVELAAYESVFPLVSTKLLHQEMQRLKSRQNTERIALMKIKPADSVLYTSKRPTSTRMFKRRAFTPAKTAVDRKVNKGGLNLSPDSRRLIPARPISRTGVYPRVRYFLKSPEPKEKKSTVLVPVKNLIRAWSRTDSSR